MKPLTKEQKAKVAREQFCRTCGDKATDGHHVIPRSVSHRTDTVDAVIPVCRRCHTGIHANAIDVLSRLTVEEQADTVFASGSLALAWRRLGHR